jgi:cell division protein FtsW
MIWIVVAFAGAFAHVVVVELFGWFPWLAERIVERAARRLPAEAQDRWCKDWLAELDALPVRGISSLGFALRILVLAPSVARVLGDEPRARYGLAERLLTRRRSELPDYEGAKNPIGQFLRGLFRTRGGDSAILLTATMCLLAFGAMMVHSVSSDHLPQGQGSGVSHQIGFLVYGAIGLVAMRVLARGGMARAHQLTAPLLAASFVLTAAIYIPHVGVSIHGARRWIGTGSLQFEPSELMKIALVLYTATLLARRPQRVHELRALARPLLLVVGAACLLVLTQPDLGTAIVIAFTVGAILVVAGAPMRKIGLIAGSVLALVLLYAIVHPYARARLTSFIDPWAHASGSSFEAVQGQIAIGSGGRFGVGPGQSAHKIFYMQHAPTSFVLAVVGEELGVVGVFTLLCLYGLIAYAGLRTAIATRSLYSALIAVGVTALIVSQALLNTFGILGLVPLTGVSLPLVSYSSSNTIVTLAAMGLLLNIATGATGHVRAIPDARRRMGAWASMSLVHRLNMHAVARARRRGSHRVGGRTRGQVGLSLAQRRIGVLFAVFLMLLLIAGARSAYLGTLYRETAARSPEAQNATKAGPVRSRENPRHS